MEMSPDQIKEIGIGAAIGFVIGACAVISIRIISKALKVILIVSAVVAIGFFVASDMTYIEGILEGKNIDLLISQFKESVNSVSGSVGAGFMSASKAASEMSIERFYAAIVGLFLGAATILLGKNKKKGK